jgi:hypothetical protein
MKPAKKDVFEYLRKRGGVNVTFDARLNGVVIPGYLHRDSMVTLLFNGCVMSDTEVTEGAVSETLSFDGCPVICVVPWYAVFSIADTDRKGIVWEEDIPREFLRPKSETRLRLVR